MSDIDQKVEYNMSLVIAGKNVSQYELMGNLILRQIQTKPHFFYEI